MKKYIANLITGSRILCGILLLFWPAFSPRFYITYILGGISDMVDGTVARKTNAANDFGAGLDTVADIIFVAACLIKLLPVLDIPGWLWFWIVVIAIIKICNIAAGFIRRKKLVALHTPMNKITGFILFLLPLTLGFVEVKYSFVVICFVATFAAIQEGYFIVTGKCR